MNLILEKALIYIDCSKRKGQRFYTPQRPKTCCQPTNIDEPYESSGGMSYIIGSVCLAFLFVFGGGTGNKSDADSSSVRGLSFHLPNTRHGTFAIVKTLRDGVTTAMGA